MITEYIQNELFAMSDAEYRDFQSRLIPGAPKEAFIGVRTPELRSFAKRLSAAEGIAEFLHELPHKYFDENQLHAFIISGMKDFDACMEELCRFLPYVDNWATCDQMSPKVFKKHKAELLGYIDEWLASDSTYTVRFAIGMLMEHFLDADFALEYPERVAKVRSDEYYVNMMIAWYFATALAKQYDAVIPFIEEKRLEPRVINLTIRKARESFRITPEQKEYLKSLKV